MVSRRDLGVSYLVAVGLALLGSVGTESLVPSGATVDAGSILALTMGVLVAGSFTLTGVGLARSRLDGTRVWRVAVWSTLGLGIPTLLVVGLFLWDASLLAGLDWRPLVTVVIAGGGIVGVLAGSLSSLRAEHERTRSLDQRNTVFRRLLRHDIRTSINIIRGHLEVLDLESSSPVDVVHEELAHIERLGEAANRLDDLDSMTEVEPIDLGALVTERVAELRRGTDGVHVETNVHAGTVVWANGLLASVVDNLLWNAVEHADGDPRLEVSVRATAAFDDTVDLVVHDHGPGFSASELAVHAGSTETALRHSDGVGLWLVRWIVDAVDGEVTVANHDDGAVVTVSLPAARAASTLGSRHRRDSP
jgi:signal transduction histidine kinase